MNNTAIAQGPFRLHIIKQGGNWDYQIRTSRDDGRMGSHLATLNPYACPARDATATGLALAAGLDALALLAELKEYGLKGHRLDGSHPYDDIAPLLARASDESTITETVF